MLLIQYLPGKSRAGLDIQFFSIRFIDIFFSISILSIRFSIHAL